MSYIKAERKQNQVDNPISLDSEKRDMGLVLSVDSKPRLKWTQELHQHFVDAVSQLGGAEKATPKTVMRAMGIPGLTLYHLKSHLQKYRLGKNQQSETCSANKEEDCRVADYENTEIGGVHINGENISQKHKQITERMQIAKALQMQLDVQKKLQEQIEVQRHLQLRIGAQGKYLQSVLKKAQEALSCYNLPSMGLENTGAKLLELISTVDTECSGCSFSGLTEMSDMNLHKEPKPSLDSSLVIHQPQHTDCSIDSGLTSSESSERLQKLHMGPSYHWSEETFECKKNSILPLMETNPYDKNWLNETQLLNRFKGEKRNFTTMSDETCVEQPTSKRSVHREKPDNQLRKLALSEELDLNSQYQCDIHSDHLQLNLNNWN